MVVFYMSYFDIAFGVIDASEGLPRALAYSGYIQDINTNVRNQLSLASDDTGTGMAWFGLSNHIVCFQVHGQIG